MESNPPVITSNTPQAPLLTANTSAAKAPAPLRHTAVDIIVSPEGDSIILNNTEYALRLVNTQQRQALISASHFLAN
ncbi:MAG: flagellar hook-length control protein FliK, partial [Shewanella sp.]